MLCLRVQAPFAAFRTFSAGSFRPSASFMTYSAAYGLLLNLAGLEMRAPDNGESTMTLIADGLPALELALGLLGSMPRQQRVYQQLHNYPVGSDRQEHAAGTYGRKYNITPVRRVFLSGLNALVAMRGSESLEADVVSGLRGDKSRYGLPFLGDNNFLPDRIEQVSAEVEARWLTPLAEAPVMDDIPGEPMRLTTTIDRADMSCTQSGLFTACDQAEGVDAIPDEAWVDVGFP